VIGKPGQFDVEVDGKLIFSKSAAGRFPEPFEVIERIPSA
jgi:selT/selW/selH-like putative selenoprotein